MLVLNEEGRRNQTQFQIEEEITNNLEPTKESRFCRIKKYVELQNYTLSITAGAFNTYAYVALIFELIIQFVFSFSCSNTQFLLNKC